MRRRILEVLEHEGLTRTELAAALAAEVAEVEPVLNELRGEGAVEIVRLRRSPAEFGLTTPEWRVTDAGRRELERLRARAESG
jgi:predicted ArsR family transcriptional regulator